MKSVGPEVIKEFQALYLREVGEELSEGEAKRLAEDLLEFFDVIQLSTRPRIDMTREMTPDSPGL
jgi:hypothetical protein